MVQASKVCCRYCEDHRVAIHWSSQASRRVGPESPKTFAPCHANITSPFASTHRVDNLLALRLCRRIVLEDAEDPRAHDAGVCAGGFGWGREASTVAVHLQHGLEHNAQRVPSPFQPRHPRQISAAEADGVLLPSCMTLDLAQTNVYPRDHMRRFAGAYGAPHV